MPTLNLQRILAFTILLIVSASCVAPTPPAVMPTVAAPTSFALSSATAASTAKPRATPAPEKTRAAPAPTKTNAPKQSPTPEAFFFPTSSYLPSTSNFNLILGRPTTNSIAANLYAKSDMQVSLNYGTASGNYSAKTNPINLKAGVPQTIEITQLTPNTTYYYKVAANGASAVEHTFHTQRVAGSIFTFTIDADPHNRDPRFDGKLYDATFTNALNDHPDFHINLGDTFMTEKLKPQTYAEVESTFTDMRPYLGIIGVGAPLFLVNGNHEGELGWLSKSKDKDKDLPVWSTQLRQQYYPNPKQNNFYSGGSRDGYYAWTWGDALFVVLDPFWYTTDKPKPEDLNNNWNWTLGKDQYDWLKSTLKTSNAKYKFVFIHHLVGGDADARGGIEFANFFEWGGNNVDGTYGFDKQRPGWGTPIHKLLVETHVNAVFHGHDHVFVKQDLDGIVYQEMPQPSNADPNNSNLATEYGYTHGTVLNGSGHLRVKVTPAQVTVDFVRAFINKPAEIAFTYVIP